MSKKVASGHSYYVRRIYVEKLFGQYTYDLKLDSAKLTHPTNLLILYGDNGSGKTTILKLILSLLTTVNVKVTRPLLLEPFLES